MPDCLRGFDRFELSAAQAKTLHADFDLLLPHTDLSRCAVSNRIIAEYKRVPGIYFWVMRHGGRSFRVCLGKTNSMSYRLRNYFGEFQPHSPNDFKLRIFREFLAEYVSDATLEMHFSPRSLLELTLAENLAVATYDPLLNRRQRPNDDARELLRDAFSAYYRSAFERLLEGDA